MFKGEAPSHYAPPTGGYGYDAPAFGSYDPPQGGNQGPAYGGGPSHDGGPNGAAQSPYSAKNRAKLAEVAGGLKDIFTNAPRLNINDIRNELEGPKPLRVLAGLGGLAMAATAALGLLNIKTAITQPARYVTQAYMALFGLAVVVIELKSAGDSNSKFNKEFMYKWFPFTSIVGGKGAAYIFFGSLGLSFGLVNSLLFIPGGFMVVMGGIYCLIHFAKCNSLAEKYDQSVYYTQIPGHSH